MRNVVLLIVGLLLLILLIFLLWYAFFRDQNEAPVAVEDSFATVQDTSVSDSVVANDSDPDGDPLTVSLPPLAEPANGALSLDPSGTFTFVPNAGFTGTDSFRYKVCDPEDACAEANVSLVVELSPVVANDDSVETMVNTAVSITVLANDTGDGLSLDAVSAAPTNGTAALAENNTILYTPNTDYTGSDTFGYAACNAGNVCDSAQVTVLVQDFQVNDDSYTTLKNTAVSNNALSNDLGGLTATETPTSSPASGTVQLQTNGDFTYTPNTDFLGEDSFTYEACNAAAACGTAVVTITVGGPVLVDDNYEVLVNRRLEENVLANDQGDGLQVNAAPVKDPESGTLTLQSDGSFVYQPTNDFEGTDTFTYEVCDSDNLCGEATATIKVTAIPSSATHTVVKGEWLMQIARCYGTSVQSIRSHNTIPYPDLIYPDQKLTITDIGSVGPYLGTPCISSHTVAAGETLADIAAMYSITEFELARVNGLYTYYYYYGYYYYYKGIYAGQQLVVPRPIPDYMRP